MNAITMTTRITITAAVLVILSAGILGYTALYDLFLSIGLFSPWLAYFFPLLFDLAELAAAGSVLTAKLQKEDDRFAWRMVLLFTGLGIVANIGHAASAWYVGKIDNVQATLAVFATSLFPLSVALVTHLVKHVVARDIERRAAVQSLAEIGQQITDKGQELDKLIKDKGQELDKLITDKGHELAQLVTDKTAELDTRQAELDKLNGQIEQAQQRLMDIKARQIEEKSRSVQELQAAKMDKIEQRRASVLSLLGQGMEDRDIAGELGVTVKTIRRDIVALNGAAHEARGLTL